MRCHSVVSCSRPLRVVQRRLVASEKLATRLPPAVVRTSGSAPTLPISTALLRLRLIADGPTKSARGDCTENRWTLPGCQSDDVAPRANSRAQYVTIKSAPARLIDVSTSLIARSSSSQPCAAAAFTAAYSPDT